MKTLKTVALAVFIVAVPVALWIGVRFMPSNSDPTPPTAVELMATLFGAATIVLGVLAIVIAVLAIWGYHAIKDESRTVAHEAARATLSDYIKSEDVQVKLRDESRKIIEEEIAKAKEGLDLAASQPAQGTPAVNSQEESQRVGKRYSKDKEV